MNPPERHERAGPLAAGETPPLPRFAWNRREVAGAVGDLGTFLPHIIGAVTVAGMAPTGVLSSFGLFYLMAGLFYGVPMGVQPMKAASAVLLIVPMTPTQVAGAGIVIGAVFFVIGATGLVSRLAAAIPATVAAGIQLGLGLSLAGLGVRLLQEQLWLGLLISAVTVLLLGNQRLPAALVAVILGVVLAQATGTGAPIPHLTLGVHLPSLVRPTWEDLLRGTELAVLPQIPLTLTNAVVATAAVTRQLLPQRSGRVTERNLALTTGLGNLIAAPFGGYPMCHGAGGIAGHYRFGARTGAAPVLIGIAFLAMGILLGDSAFALLALAPPAVLGSLLFFSGIELAVSSRPQRFSGPDLFPFLVVAALSVTANPAIGFVTGMLWVFAFRRGWLRFD
ncbi:MAG: molybdate transporter family protein [Thermomicrobiales bacterium]